jgi:hypothetical protein
LTFRPPSRVEFDTTALESYREIYQRANDPRLATAETHVSGGRFECTLPVPATARGDCHVRVYVQGQQSFAVGAADLTIGR